MGASQRRYLLEARWPRSQRRWGRFGRQALALELARVSTAGGTSGAAPDRPRPDGTAPDRTGAGRPGSARARSGRAGSAARASDLARSGDAAQVTAIAELRPASGAADDSQPPPGPDLLARAERFLALFHAENPEAGSLGERMRQVRGEIKSAGTYRHTTAELTFAARVAWRNSARCIGRLYWRSLRVRDRREVSTAAQIAAESLAHLRAATNGGRIRPLITVFAPDSPGQPGPRILNAQLVRYAGYSDGETGPVGDPASLKITQLAHELGWRSRDPRGRFDVLPLIVKPAGAGPTWHEVPADAVLEVPLQHPDYSWFAELGLRWYAVPVISDMRLEAGGICYPAAPFNGWYMCTEIGSRDLGDAARYNQLPAIASRMGLNSNDDRTLWKDRAVTELNLAVMHSFTSAGVTITDHHTESLRFLKHLEIEERSGRACPADWSWIVPPAAASTTPVFHRYYANFDVSPNFYRHADDPVCEDGACADGGPPAQTGERAGTARQVPLPTR